jgi:hypothetical protein
MFVPVTVYDVPVVYSIWWMVSTTLVVDVVSEVTVPLVNCGTTEAACALPPNKMTAPRLRSL